MTEKLFTVAEAESLLPSLERTLDQIESLRFEMQRRMDRLKILDVLWGPRIEEAENPDRDEFLAERAGVRRVLERTERLVEDRILARGVRFPQGGLEHGLVDFPTRFEGRTVYLCWKRGEEGIEAWHEVDGGYAGRRPLTPDVARRMSSGDDDATP